MSNSDAFWCIVFSGLLVMVLPAPSPPSSQDQNDGRGGEEGGGGPSLTDRTSLTQEIIEKNDHRYRPLTDQSSEILVYVTFHLLSILSIDEVKQKVEMNIRINFSWVDEIRVWNSSGYNGISLIHPDPTDIWRPRVFVANSLEDRDVFEDDYAPLTLYASGITRWYPASIFYTSCSLTLYYFPYDTQHCSLVIYTNDFAEELVLEPTSNEVDLSAYNPNGEWALMSTKVERNIVQNGDENITQVNMTLKLKRKPEHFVVNILIPIMVLSLLSFVVFVLPRESGERASFAITVLLSLTLFMSIVTEILPKQPDSFPLVVIYLFCLLLLSGLSVIVTVFDLAWHQYNLNTRIENEQKASHLLGWNGQDSDDQHSISAFSRKKAGSIKKRNLDKSEKNVFDNQDVCNVEHMLRKKTPNYSNSLTTKGNQVEPFNEGYGGPGDAFARGPRSRSHCERLMKSLDAFLFSIFLSAWLIITVYFWSQCVH